MRRHRVLVIGVGSIGERHLRCFQATGRADVALAEVDPALRASVAERYGVSGGFARLEDALAAGRPDVAVVATPAPLHVPMATALADAGVHVLIEKPLGTRLEGVDNLQSVIEKRGVTAAVGYVYRAYPLLRAFREEVLGGRFGRPVELVVVSGQHFPLYRPAYRSIYYNDRATGGGAIQDALTHVINAGEWLVGPVDRLVADAAHLVLDGVSVEDTAHVLARHGGVLASYSLNQHQAPNEATITLVCERGTLRCEFHASRWRWAAEPGGGWNDEPVASLTRDEPFILQANGFLDAVDGIGPVACTVDEALQTLRVNLAAAREPGGSRLEGRPERRTRRAMTESPHDHETEPEPTVGQLFDLTGRVALITGGTGHLGRSMARPRRGRRVGRGHQP
ncbi:MAG: Gfo/Idh/MocA family oxidoreductase [Isosphaeraceae bacterium]